MHTPEKETVSVVIPLYNAAPFIADTIASVLAQTFASIHIYVVDDFSTDESPAIVKALADKDARVSYHLMPKKGGCPAPTKNEGVRLARGEYVAFSDHDDWWHAEKLAKQVAFFESHPEVNLVGSNVEIVDTDHDTSLGTFWKHPEQITPETIRGLVLDGPIFATTTCMIGRRSYLAEHPFDEQLIGSDEYDLSLHASLDDPKQVVILPETLAYWRWHSASLSHSGAAASRALQDETRFADKVLARTDLTEAEREQVRLRLRMVTRRAGNAELDAGNKLAAIGYYKTAAAEGDKGSRVMLGAVRVAPYLARLLVTWKRSRSHATPVFR